MFWNISCVFYLKRTVTYKSITYKANNVKHALFRFAIYNKFGL